MRIKGRTDFECTAIVGEPNGWFRLKVVDQRLIGLPAYMPEDHPIRALNQSCGHSGSQKGGVAMSSLSEVDSVQ
jgi:hypothetical protein